MNSLSLILRILAIVAALAAGALFMMSKGTLAEQQTALDEAENATAAVQAELTAANEKVTTLEASLSEQREALAEEKRKLDSARSEMYTAKQEVSRTQKQLEEARASISELENTARGLRADLLEAEQSVSTDNSEAETAQLRERIAELEESNADLRESLEAEKSSAMASRPGANSNNSSSANTGSFQSNFTPTTSRPLPVATLGIQTTIQSTSPESGLIVLANNPELGLTQGVEVRVIKDRKSFGKIKVVQLTDDLVVANILPGAESSALTPGSTVSLLR